MSYDVIVIGAGPAGMTAAALAAEAGASVLLLDDQPGAGGQIYRNIENAADSRGRYLGQEYMAGRPLLHRLRKSNIDYLTDATVWQVSDEREVGYSHEGSARLLRAPYVLLATGAMERPFPIKGWTLPGVMTAGAAQTLLKSSGLAADGAVFAGSGPLLYLVVHQYLRAGVKVAALVDTTAKANRKHALQHLPAALSRWDLLARGRRWMKDIQRSGTTMISGVMDLQVLGDDAAQGLAFQTGNGEWREIAGTHIFLHQGVVPNVNLSMSIGLDHAWHSRQLCWRPRIDDWGQGSVDGIVIAGDGAGIDGAVAAQASGEMAALDILYRLGKLSIGERDQRAAAPHRVLTRERRIRPFLDAWFRPAGQFRVPNDGSTTVCRCEELTLDDVRAPIGIGIAGPNQLKSYCRAGMGPCQGRFCGLTVQEIIAKETSRAVAKVGYFRLRPPIKPLCLEELANLQIDGSEE